MAAPTPQSLEEANGFLADQQQKLQTAAEMGKMLLERCDTITKESAEAQAALQSEITKLKEEVAAQAIKANELATSNEHLKNQNDRMAEVVKDLEGENENLLDEAGTKEGDASSAARRAKAELEIKCRELEDQVDQYKIDLEHTKNEVDALTKSKDRLKSEKDQIEGKLQDTEGRCRSLEESVQQKESELRIYTKTAGDDAMGEVRAMKEKTDSITRDLEMMRKKNSELQDVNNILTKQHEDDQVLLEDVKATNMMLREALETKELEWGTSDSQLASFAPKESLLGEIEQHFNRFQTFGSPQRGSSKMPNFMDVVKRDFENLAMRIHRLRQKMEKKWPEPPPGGAQPGVGGSPYVGTAEGEDSAPAAAPAAEEAEP